MKKIALITGVTGQDGCYLTELLLEKGYMVYGLVRRSSLFNRSRIDDFQVFGDFPKMTLHKRDLGPPITFSTAHGEK